jgi:CubicO group peptidase (beta-lactamase class C family)/D-alanyl-D-alanine dipeptidase
MAPLPRTPKETFMRTRWLFPSLPLLIIVAVPAAGKDVPAAPAYREAVRRLEPFIAREVEEKGIPALSVALIDDQKVVWSRGFGLADPQAKKPADADTVYRVGSVSKLFTDLAVMRLVERGVLDLDAPVTRYLPDFKPENPFDKPITLRMLMSHRAGLVREPPVGNYFDPTTPSLEQTVKSLNSTRLVYPPGKRTKYSNAGIAVVGRILEKTQKQPFPRYLATVVLKPLGMDRSKFEPDPAVTPHLAKALMWTYQGREFRAPTFELGMAPAGSLYSTANDLGRFLSALFAGGKTKAGRVVEEKTLEKMWTPQFAKPGAKEGFGIGFAVSTFAGHRRIGHGGAVYGFSTEVAGLPEEKLGVVVISARDVTNTVTRHIADVALKQLLAVRDKKPLPDIVETKTLAPGFARSLVGRWQSGKKAVEFQELGGRLYLWRGSVRVEVRRLDEKTLLTDGRTARGTRISVDGDALVIDKDRYRRVKVSPPKPAPERWAGLLGEYGWDHNTLVILEKEGKLHALIEWFFLYPLEEVDRDTFAFPDYGLYHGEKLIFSRDRSGRATKVEAANVVFKRRDVGRAGTFKIVPTRPLEELRKAALKAKPPREKGEFRKPKLVELARLEPSLRLGIRYATRNNFLNTPFYQQPRAFMQKPAAEALVRAQSKLAKQGLGLWIFDGYRPWHVTKMFWDATPPRYRNFVADPAQGSRHNRGCAVDLTLFDRKTGKPIPMVSGYDEFTDRAYPLYVGGTSRQRYFRDLLRRAMQEQGFTVYEAEWWHFDFKDWKKYPILNFTFEEVAAGKGTK